MKSAMFVLLAAAATTMSVASSLHAQTDPGGKVDVRFDRYYDYDQTTAILKEFASAYPDLVTLQSIGTSLQGRDVWLVTVNAPKTGPHDRKPAMYIDGSIHGNEIQATEVVLNTLSEQEPN